MLTLQSTLSQSQENRVLIPSAAIRQLLGSSQSSANGVLTPAAVDSAMEQVREKGQLELSSELEDVLVSGLPRIALA